MRLIRELGLYARIYGIILRLGVWSIVLTVGYMPYSTASTLRGGGGIWALVWEEVMGTSLGGGYGD